MNNYLYRLLCNISDNYMYYIENEAEREKVVKNENILVMNVTTPANYFHAI